MHRLLRPFLSALLLTACGGGAPPVFKGGNNQALLEGAAVGTGVSTAPDELRKLIRVKALNPDDSLEVLNAWALRPRNTDQSTLFYIEVTNGSDQPRCLLKLDAFTFRDELGEALEPAKFSFVFGSVGDVGRAEPQLTDTCLAPGETGYVLQILVASATNRVWDRVTDVDFQWSFTETRPVDPPQIIRPTAYEPLVDGGLRVGLRNDGSAAALLEDHFTRVILLDAVGAPVWWGFANDRTEPADLVLQPGTEGAVEGDESVRFYSGSATRMQVYLGFDALRVGGALRAAPAPASNGIEGWRQRLDVRDAQAAALAARLGR